MTGLARTVSVSLIAIGVSAFAAGPVLAQSATTTAKPAATTTTAKPATTPAATTAKPAVTTAATTTAPTATATPVSLPAAGAVAATTKPAIPAVSTATVTSTGADLSTLPSDLYMWVKMCSPDEKTKKEVCMTTQRLLSNTGLHVVTATIREVTGDPKSRQLMISGPLGMQLDPGLKAQVDTGKLLSMKYALCFVDGCYTQTNIDDAFMKLMKAGKVLNVTVVSPQGQPIVVPLSLANFSKVYSAKGVDPATAKLQFDILAQATVAKAKADAGKTAEPTTKVN